MLNILCSVHGFMMPVVYREDGLESEVKKGAKMISFITIFKMTLYDGRFIEG